MKMLLENNCHICSNGFELDITKEGSFMDRSINNI